MRQRTRTFALRLLLAFATLPSLTGCLVVKPWEREVLSLRSMDPSAETAENKFREHWAESRRGARGGFAAAGGGCGCN
jgi:hypothetical protein